MPVSTLSNSSSSNNSLYSSLPTVLTSSTSSASLFSSTSLSKSLLVSDKFIIQSSTISFLTNSSASTFASDEKFLQESNREFENDCVHDTNISSLYSNSSTEEEHNCSDNIKTKENNDDTSSIEPLSTDMQKRIRQRLKLRNEVGKVLEKFSFLATRDGNKQLMKSVYKDRKMLKVLPTDDTQTLNKSCELGKSLSFLVQDKAKRLNTAAYPIIVLSILDHYHEACYNEEIYQKEKIKKIDFVKLSQMYGNFIHTNFLKKDSFNCSAFSLLNFDKNMKIKRKTVRKRRNFDDPLTKLTEAGTEAYKMDSKYDVLTLKQANEMYERLRIKTKISPIIFWSFVIDSKALDGFKNSCKNIFLMTLLARRGLVGFSVSYSDNFCHKSCNGKYNANSNGGKFISNRAIVSDGILMIQALKSDEKVINDNSSLSPSCSSFGDNFLQVETILSGWNFDIWTSFCQALKLNSETPNTLEISLHSEDSRE